MLDTLQYLNNGYSFIRYDESIINKTFNSNDVISQKLQNLLVNYDKMYTNNKLLIGLPTIFKSLYWRNYWINIYDKLEELLKQSSSYFGSSHVIRPLVFQQYKQEAIDMWKNIWKNKNIIFVVHTNSKFSIIDILFDNMTDYTVLEYSDNIDIQLLEKIKNKLLSFEKNSLFLISIDIIAPLLVYDCSLQYQAIDIGELCNNI